mmetsp:Transcript_113727/g.226345  ORF Transcript_113727/g.226345 Transcript_113727/m.226345 type:complete len:92 (-) Transcript_113727:47-322(-)
METKMQVDMKDKSMCPCCAAFLMASICALLRWRLKTTELMPGGGSANWCLQNETILAQKDLQKAAGLRRPRRHRDRVTDRSVTRKDEPNTA